MDERNSFRIYRGLQRPLEFMGIKGRYIFYVMGGAIGGILSFIIGFIVAGFFAGLLSFTFTVVPLAIWIFTKQKKGLHSKKTFNGIYIITSLFHDK